jgi:carbamoyltransferase
MPCTRIQFVLWKGSSVAFILGINAYHGDSSACLVKDGVLLAAAEEERFRRAKHWAGFPSYAIDYCMREAGIQIGDVDHIAINQDSKANLWRKVEYLVGRRPNLSLVADRIRNKRERANVRELLASTYGASVRAELHEIEHHLSHLYSAFHVSPFGEAWVVSVDGFGDFASAAWGVGSGPEVTVEDKVYFPHSLGIFYQAMTQWLGFPNYGDEYKVMGLAPYGRPKHMTEMRQILLLDESGGFKLNLEFFRHHRERIEYEWDTGEPKVGTLFSQELDGLLGQSRRQDEELTQRHKDIARSVQAMYEEAFFHLLNKLHSQYPTENLCLAGGCAMNSVANGKVYHNTKFKHVYIQAAAGDAGGAIGAACAVWQKLGGERRFAMDHAYLGPEFADDYIRNLIETKRSYLEAEACDVARVPNEASLCDQVAHALTKGQVIGWFQGRMEWGPRALGNRSILGDPRRGDMKDILNLKIKRRESFRPFAPSVLSEAVPDWFEQTDDVPFMMQVYPIRADKRAYIPAVTHVDGSGRLQTVHESTNPRYYHLIQAFERLTGVPMLLNTSFNENEPIVCRPEEALDCFLRTKMDVLVLGSWLICRRPGQDQA